MNLILLILAMDSGHYIECQQLWKTYMNAYPNITSYFIKLSPSIEENVVLIEDTIYVKGDESWTPGCLYKTIKSIEYVLNNHEPFDFLFRTNMSSVINLPLLYQFIEDNRENIYYSGVVNAYDITFASGAGLLFSKQCCSDLIANKTSLHYSVIDDVSIGIYFRDNNVSIFPLTRFDVERDASSVTKEMIQSHYHIRCKCLGDNSYTPTIMKRIIELMYDNEIH